MPLNYGDYALRVLDQSLLDSEIDKMHGGVEKHLTKIALEMDNLEALTPALGLKNRHLRDANAKHTEHEKKSELLRMWKRGNGIRATYKVLLTAFVDTNNHDAADELVNCLNDSDSSAPAPAPAPAVTGSVASSQPEEPVGPNRDFPRYLGKEVPDSSDLGFVKAKDGKRFRLLEEIAEHWKRIAKTLKLETPKITSIQRSSEDDDDRIAAVFQVWFENATAMANSDSYPLSWYGLNEILKDSELAGIADRFFKFLEKC